MRKQRQLYLLQSKLKIFNNYTIEQHFIKFTELNSLIKSGKPSSPTKKKITTVDGFESSKVQLEWEEPSDLGNANPKELKYKVEWCSKKEEKDDKDGKDCRNANISGTKTTLQELEADKEYNVVITPINPLGVLGEPLKLKFQTSEKDGKCEQ